MKYLRSPLNYTGGKYMLLGQILPLFPQKIECFVELFAGGCNVGLNVDAKRMILNDNNKHIIELYEYFEQNSVEFIVDEIEKTIRHFGLSESSLYGFEYYDTNSMKGLASYNKIPFESLRNTYNKRPNPLLFYVTLIFSFNNQIRFNPQGEYNSHVNKRDFNSYMRRNLIAFIQRLKTLDISWSALHYKDVPIQKDAFVYLDPPYLASQAVYNERGAWCETKEGELLDYIDTLNAKGVKFALSNVLQNKGVKNELLSIWSKNYKVHKLDFTYHNCNYHAQNKKTNTTHEVLITNY